MEEHQKQAEAIMKELRTVLHAESDQEAFEKMKMVLCLSHRIKEVFPKAIKEVKKYD